MAKPATPLAQVSPPKKIPDGCELIQVQRKLTGVTLKRTNDKGKEVEYSPKAVVSQIVPISGNAEGVLNWIELRSRLGASAKLGDDLGVRCASNAIRAGVFNIVPKLTLETVADSAAFILPISGPNIIDPFEAMMGAVQEFRDSHGRPPSAEEYEEIRAAFASMTG